MKKILLLWVVLLNHSLVFAQLPAYVSPDHLEGWWSFSGNAQDASVHGRNGIVTGAALMNDRLGNPASAYSFNGTSDLISVPVAGITDVNRSTVSAWVRYTGNANPARQYNTYFGLGSFPQHPIGYGYEYNGNKLNLYRKCQTTIFSVVDLTDKWHHMAVVQDSNKTYIYIDGQLFNTAVNTQANCLGNTATLFLGAYPGDSQWMTGYLDDVGFWSRALLPCEIMNLFTSSSSSFTTQPSDQTVSTGGTAVFSAMAASATAAYQWQLGSGSNFVDLVNGGQYSGVHTGTLTVSGLLNSNNGQQYRCIAENEGCSAISDTATLSVTMVGIDGPDDISRSFIDQNIPNPSYGGTDIAYYIHSLKADAAIVIYDLSGKKIKVRNISQSGSGNWHLEKNDLAKGMYFYSLFIDGKSRISKKLLRL